MSKRITIPLSPATLAALSVAVAGATLALVFALGFESDCKTRWQGSGFEHRYEGGQCLVLAGSRWVPEAQVTVHVRSPSQ